MTAAADETPAAPDDRATGLGPAPESTPKAPEPAGPAAESFTPATPAQASSRLVIVLLALVALAALVASLALWQKLGSIQELLARQSADSGAQAVEARTMARQAQEAARETAARLAVTESKLQEVALQRAQLEDLMQSLSRSRDENLVVDIDSALRLAQQQAQLTGSAEPLLAALKTADQRIARAAQPRLVPVQRAIARDAERIRNATVIDLPATLLKLDDLTRMADDMPLVNGAPQAPGTPRDSDPPANALWWQKVLAGVRDEMRKLVRVSRIEQPEASLLSPEQAFFVRENLKLKLLNVRMGLLARQPDSSRAELAQAVQIVNRYFDPASRRTQQAAGVLQQLGGQIRTAELPRLDESLAALATVAAGR